MIDLHTHTNNSDGSKTTIEMLEEAEVLGIDYLSITDHNTLKAYYEMDKNSIKEIYSGRLINGIEITTYYKGEIIEVLVYGFDLIKMQKLIKKFGIDIDYRERYKNRFKILKRNYSKIGIIFDYDKYKENIEMNNTTIYNEIISHPENNKYFLNIENKNSKSLFFRNEVFNPKSNFYIDQTELYPNLQTVIDVAHKANGLVFLAHPYVYSENIINSIEDIILEYKIDGLECFYPTFKENETKHLLDLTEKYNLLSSGGSDYHGKNKVNHFLGKFYNNKTITLNDIKFFKD